MTKTCRAPGRPARSISARSISARSIPARAALAVAGLALLAGCSPTEELLRPDASRGALGQDGRFGALLYRTSLRVRVDQSLPTDIYLPTDGAGVAEGPFPPVVLVQGGLVGAQRYGWLGAHIASRGFVVVAPAHSANLALFDSANGVDALAAARRSSATGTGPLTGTLADSPGLVVGHSLGGVVAVKHWLAEPDELSHLVLLASVPDAADDLSVRTDGRVLSLVGTQDGRIDAERISEGAARFFSPTVAATVEGMNHFQFTDDAAPSELATDNEPTVPDNVARTRVLYLIDAALDEVRGSGDGVANDVLDDPDNWPTGLERIALPEGS